jgi:hypothetical protein
MMIFFEFRRNITRPCTGSAGNGACLPVTSALSGALTRRSTASCFAVSPEINNDNNPNNETAKRAYGLSRVSDFHGSPRGLEFFPSCGSEVGICCHFLFTTCDLVWSYWIRDLESEKMGLSLVCYCLCGLHCPIRRKCDNRYRSSRAYT